MLLNRFTDEVAQFVLQALRGVEGRVLEVGAGNGALASRLRSHGIELDAIDKSPSAVAEAEADGEEVTEADWLDWHTAPYAAVVFTRSLHHIEPLELAVAHIAEVAPGGLVIGDEHAAEDLDERGAQLLGDARALLSAAGMTTALTSFAVDPLAAHRYRTTVEHPISTGAAVLQCLGDHAEVLHLERTPFVARFVTQFLDASHPRAAEVSAALVDIEHARIDAGLMPAIGFRFIARLRR